MALQQHLDTLQKRHDDLDLKIHAEYARPSPDERRLIELKKQKLHLKDDISRLTYVGQAA